MSVGSKLFKLLQNKVASSSKSSCLLFSRFIQQFSQQQTKHCCCRSSKWQSRSEDEELLCFDDCLMNIFKIHDVFPFFRKSRNKCTNTWRTGVAKTHCILVQLWTSRICETTTHVSGVAPTASTFRSWTLVFLCRSLAPILHVTPW